MKKPKLLKRSNSGRGRTRLRAAKNVMKGKVTSQKATEVAEEAEDQHTSRHPKNEDTILQIFAKYEVFCGVDPGTAK